MMGPTASDVLVFCRQAHDESISACPSGGRIPGIFKGQSNLQISMLKCQASRLCSLGFRRRAHAGKQSSCPQISPACCTRHAKQQRLLSRC